MPGIRVHRVVCQHIELVSQDLRAAMQGVVFWCGDRLEVLGIVSLQAANERDAEPASQVRIFAVGFLTSSPLRIAKVSTNIQVEVFGNQNR
jgi:hypothetical protein